MHFQLKLLFVQTALTFSVLCLDSNSQDLGYGPFHVNENSAKRDGNSAQNYGSFHADENSAQMQALAAAIKAYESNSDKHPDNAGPQSSDRNAGGNSPFSAGGASMSSMSTPGGGNSMTSGGSGGMGSSPFTTGSGSGTGSGPFSTASKLGGTDMSSMAGLSNGPGGLSGSNFASNANMLMGHDFSADLTGSSIVGVYNSGTGPKGSSQYGIDTAKFDTSDYQSMLDQLFNPQTYDKGLLSSPFHGDSYKLPQGGQSGSGQGHGYETSHESSMGSYASTDMSSSVYNANSGSYIGGQGQTHNGNGGSGHVSTGGSGVVHTPFDASHFPTGGHSSGFSSNSGMYAESPFKISDAEKGDTPFKVNGPGGYSSGSHASVSGFSAVSPFTITNGQKGDTPFKISQGQGSTPFQITDTSGGNPFDTSKFFTGDFGTGQSFESLSGGQKFEGGNDLSGQMNNQGGVGKNGLDQYGNVDFSKLSGTAGSDGSQFQNSGSANNHGLDEYGNVDFSKLSGLSGSSVDQGFGDYGKTANTGTFPEFSGSTYIDYSASKPSYNAGVNTGVSESQFKTPFESDNYNDLLGNPFDSSSNFNSNHENFNQPFSNGPTQSGGLQTYQGSGTSYQGTAGMPSYLGGQSQVSDQGPAGDPFSQGGARMH